MALLVLAVLEIGAVCHGGYFGTLEALGSDQFLACLSWKMAYTNEIEVGFCEISCNLSQNLGRFGDFWWVKTGSEVKWAFFMEIPIVNGG